MVGPKNRIEEPDCDHWWEQTPRKNNSSRFISVSEASETPLLATSLIQTSTISTKSIEPNQYNVDALCAVPYENLL